MNESMSAVHELDLGHVRVIGSASASHSFLVHLPPFADSRHAHCVSQAFNK